MKTKDEQVLLDALIKLINNCQDSIGTPKKPTEKQIMAAYEVARKVRDKPTK